MKATYNVTLSVYTSTTYRSLIHGASAIVTVTNILRIVCVSRLLPKNVQLRRLFIDWMPKQQRQSTEGTRKATNVLFLHSVISLHNVYNCNTILLNCCNIKMNKVRHVLECSFSGSLIDVTVSSTVHFNISFLQETKRRASMTDTTDRQRTGCSVIAR